MPSTENKIDIGTDLYRDILSYDYGDPETKELMVKVWSGTPWMIDVLTGSHDEKKQRDIMQWCLDEFGPEAWPIHGKSGQWHSGGVTINGWTWMGFSTEEQMQKFLTRWPSPNTMLCGSADSPASAANPSAIQAESAAATVRQKLP